MADNWIKKDKAGEFTGATYNLSLDTLRERRWIGRKEYEMTDHLGNVMVTFLDRKTGYGNTSGSYIGFNADVASITDYYPFGMPMEERSLVNGAGFRFGLNGIEKTNEVAGKGNHYTALYGEYNPRIVWRWNTDPKPFPSISSYAMYAGNPIWHNDPLLDTIIVNNKGGITRNDKTDNLVFMSDKKNKLTALGELGKKINANTIYKNLAMENAKEAKGIWNPLTFKNYVKTNGKWDLKNDKNSIFGLGNDGKTKFLFQGKEMEAQDVGNHHFGVVGKASGLFSEEFMLSQAGEYQIKSGTSKPEWQPVIKIQKDLYLEHGMKVKTTETIKLPPYGDDPRDQEWIKAGFQYYKHIKE